MTEMGTRTSAGEPSQTASRPTRASHPLPDTASRLPQARTVVLAPDSFKESLSAAEACASLEAGVLAAWPRARCLRRPMADGGEGTVEAVVGAGAAELVEVVAHDALMRVRRAHVAWDARTRTAVVEAAQGPGLEHVAPEDRDIWGATSAGVGEMVLAALDLGAHRIVIGLGGSATNDGGSGMLAALGVRFRGAEAHEGDAVVPVGPRDLVGVEGMELSGLDPRLREVEIIAATDVTNPLLGPHGASEVFGAQKGASPEDVVLLEEVLSHLADMGERACGRDLRGAAGAGAAGGLGWACLQFLGARMRPGVEVVADLVDLSGAVRGAALVLTGEGSVDAQTLGGKTPMGVARVAAQADVPVVVLAGRVGAGAEDLLDVGVAAVVPIVREAGDLGEVLAAGGGNLTAAAEMVCRLIDLGAGTGDAAGTAGTAGTARAVGTAGTAQ